MPNTALTVLKRYSQSLKPRKHLFYTITFLLLLSLVLTIGYSPASIAFAQSSTNRSPRVYLPLIISSPSRQVLLGTYTDGYLGQQSSIDNEVKALDTWSGKRISIVGTFIAIEDQNPGYNIPVPLGLIWDSGYTPFVNLDTQKTLQTLNSGSIDNQIKAMASAFKTWRDQGLSKGQNRKAFLAPLQEMNGNWVKYYGSPSDFKAAFAHIQKLFNDQGAGPAVRWVFAPNGWSDPSSPPFEDYYPGDSAVEAIAFSSYNAGYCPSAAWKEWDGPDKVFAPYIQRIRTMAPSKTIYVAQTATTAYDASGYNPTAKNTWLENSYTYLANTTGVAGIIYFNKTINQSCDWPFFTSSGTRFDGYKIAVSSTKFVYISPEALSMKVLTP